MSSSDARLVVEEEPGIVAADCHRPIRCGKTFLERMRPLDENFALRAETRFGLVNRHQASFVAEICFSIVSASAGAANSTNAIDAIGSFMLAAFSPR